VGDFTAMIGDPSGKSKTRPPLSLEETRAYGQTYFEQARRILDPERLEVCYNSDWLGGMTFAEVIRLAGQYTVARMLERDDFEKRYKSGEPISVHEFLYPLAQGQDSVELAADVELGGTDQLFNLLVGRSLQESAGQEPQVALTMPILEGTDGVEKMSKSLGNYIGIADPPEEVYGKTLSIPDALIGKYFELATDVPAERLPELARLAEANPRDAKHELAWNLARMYHGAEAADAARAHFERTIIQGRPGGHARGLPWGPLRRASRSDPEGGVRGLEWGGPPARPAGGRLPRRRARGRPDRRGLLGPRRSQGREAPLCPGRPRLSHWREAFARGKSPPRWGGPLLSLRGGTTRPAGSPEGAVATS
jgi:tyrosyl-tRNA synthetase